MAEATNDIINPPVEERLPADTRNCLVVSYDLETTGLSSDDEIIQVGAYTYIPAGTRSSEFSQFILPATRHIHPEAACKIGLKVHEGNLYDTRTKSVVPTVTESEGLLLFLKWLTSVKEGYDGIVLVSHGAIFLDIPVLIRAIQRTGMSESFFQVVLGFCDSNAIFQEDNSRCYRSLSLQHLYQNFVGSRRQVHRAAEDAKDLYTLLSRYFKVESLSLDIPRLEMYTYTFRCMEFYSKWKYYVDVKIEGLRVIVRNQRKTSEKKKTIILRNLVAAGYDIQNLLDDFSKSPSEQSFKEELKRRIQVMKSNHESYLLDTRIVSVEEVINAVTASELYLSRRSLHPQ
ncbi:uncharacterized protein LOC110828433 isoform X2 [Zootermopsis nevadensis]|uniref:uncharacterized protein LOC110828433 isoform X2 n=1 Tax=Zootermopsis nevadensis TaxID=136037 RepID=UPI000B8EDBB6|nr:uncharacterized protein LOC110828433 isoform X2 [Zootermopsis nevadensis]